MNPIYKGYSYFDHVPDDIFTNGRCVFSAHIGRGPETVEYSLYLLLLDNKWNYIVLGTQLGSCNACSVNTQLIEDI